MSKACEGCGGMMGEVQLPVDDGAKLVCWICAHDVTVHGCALDAHAIDCDCTREQVYPPDVIARRDAATRAYGLSIGIEGEVISGEIKDRSQAPTVGTAPTYIGNNSARRDTQRLNLHDRKAAIDALVAQGWSRQDAKCMTFGAPVGPNGPVPYPVLRRAVTK